MRCLIDLRVGGRFDSMLQAGCGGTYVLLSLERLMLKDHDSRAVEGA